MVSGVASTKPTGPHSQVQNDAATMIATGDRPELWPKITGSSTCPANSSRTTNRITVSKSISQPDPTAAASMSGKIAEMNAPMYGTKRRIIATSPHNGAEGTPISCRPMPIAMPKAALKAICVRKSRLSLSPASSSAAVVRARQTDETIPEVLTLEQDEDHEDDDNAGRRERR